MRRCRHSAVQQHSVIIGRPGTARCARRAFVNAIRPPARIEDTPLNTIIHRRLRSQAPVLALAQAGGVPGRMRSRRSFSGWRWSAVSEIAFSRDTKPAAGHHIDLTESSAPPAACAGARTVGAGCERGSELPRASWPASSRNLSGAAKNVSVGNAAERPVCGTA